MTFTRRKIGVALAACVLVGAGLGMVSGKTTFGPAPEARIDALIPDGPGPLDGLVFDGMLGPEGAAKDVRDTFVFEDGTFVSRECELRCEYPARPYTAAQADGGWSFESTTRCPYKDATIVWRGTVQGDRITGVATWTMRRWYWTIERDFAFEAERRSDPPKAISTNG